MRRFLLLYLLLTVVITLKSQDYYMDAVNGTTITTCQGNVFPSWLCSDGLGRPTYCNNEDYTVTFYSGSPGTPIRISFLSLGLIPVFSVSSLYMDIESGFDFLRVYNGPSTASPLLASLTGTSSTPFNFTGTGGYLTLRFTSDGGVRGFGWWGILGCQPANCNGNLPASDLCVSSPAICDLNGYCGSTSGWYTPDNMNLGVSQGGPFCAAAGVGSIENNSWIKFIPNSTNATISFTSSACTSTNVGVQAAIFSTPDCSSFSLITCTSQATGQGIASMSGTTFIPGNTYYIMIDGYAGNSCQYSVAATSGVAVSSIVATSTVICNGQSAGISISAPGSSPSYSWSTGATTNSITVSPTVTTVYTGTVVSGFCNEILTRTITVNPLPNASASVSQSITCSVPNPLLTGTTNLAAPVSYSWNGPSGFTSTSQNPNVTVPGTYSLTITKNGCTSTLATIAVPVNTTAPVFTPTQSGTITCVTTTAALQSNIAGMTYTWVAPGGGSIIGGTTNSVNAIAQGAGIYSVTVRDPLNGCSRTATVNVPLNTGSPTVTISPAPFITCASPTVGLSASASNVTYNWSGPGIISGNSTATPSVTAVGVYSLLVTSTVNGCTATAQTTVSSNFTVSATASASGSITCVTNTVQLSGGPAGMNYTWTAPAGSSIVSGSNSANAIAQGAGTYTLTVQNPSNGCLANSTIGANVNTATISALPATSGSITCVTNSVNLSVSTAAGYTWTAPAGASVLGINSQNAVGLGYGTYSVTITNPVNGCPTTTFIATGINTLVITPTIAIPAVLTCSVTQISLNASPGSGVTYSWSSSGAPITGTSVASASVTSPGTYSLVLTNTVNGCNSSPVSVSVTQNTVLPSFVQGGSTQTIACNGTATLVGGANPATCTPVWQGVTSGAGTYSGTVSGPGTYTLGITNPANGCSAQTIYTVTSSSAPVVNLSNSNTITCTTLTSQVIATSALASLTYTWSGPVGGITGPANTASVTVGTGGIYTVIVTNTANSCTVALTQSVPFNTTAVTATVATNATSLTCNNGTVALFSGATSNGGSSPTFAWSGPGLSGPANTPTAAAVSPGIYSVSITNTLTGCNGTATVNVISNTIAPTAVSVTPATFSLSCSTSTAMLTAGSSAGIPTYSWIAPGGGTVLSGATSNTAIISGQGVYTVVVTNTINGCSATAQATITPNSNAPSLSIANSNLQITCADGTPTTAVTTTVTSVIYNWGPASGITGATTNSMAAFTNAGTYTCTVTNTINNCSSDAVITVNSNTASPTASVAAMPFITCSNTLVTINPVYTPSANLLYSWSGTGIVGTSTNASVSTSTVLPLVLSFTNTQNGCQATATFVPNSDLSVPQITVSPLTGTALAVSCLSQSLQVTAIVSPVTNLTYTWSNGATTPSISISSPGTYSIAVTNTLNGCSSGQYSFTVSGGTVAPSFTLAATASIACNSQTAALTVTAPAPNTYSYFWSGPSVIAGATTSTPVIGGAGVYVVTVTNTLTACTATQTVTVNSNSVTALFTASPPEGPAPLEVVFTNASTGATNYNWNYGNGQGDVSTNGAATYTQAGQYLVTLTASSGPCVSTYTLFINVEEGLTIGVLPNTFTPNGDGTNDLFTLPVKGAKTVNFEVYNRWGGIMYRAYGSKVSWDGIADNGNPASDGTYFYILKVTGFDDKEVVKTGTLNLFR